MTEELKQAAQQALEALGYGVAWKEGGHQKARAAIDALGAALTTSKPAQAGEVDERVALIREMATRIKAANPGDAFFTLQILDELVKKLSAHARATPPQQAAGEPVGEVRIAHYGGRSRSIGFSTIALFVDIETLPVGTKLYTHPAPGVPDVEDLRDRLVAISAAVADLDDRAAQSMLGEILRILAAAQAKGGEHG